MAPIPDSRGEANKSKSSVGESCRLPRAEGPAIYTSLKKASTLASA
jgi:hypothetical protein